MRNSIRHLFHVAAVCLALLAASPIPQVRSVAVRLRGPVFAAQENSQLCWAATISNLFAYYGYRVTQSRIVSEVYGVPANIRSGNYSNLSRLLHRPWQDDTGQTFHSTLSAALDILNGVNAITNDAIRDALAANRPLVIGTTSHAMLAVGMQYTEVAGRVSNVLGIDLYDPWPGNGFRKAHPLEVTPVPLGGSLMFIAEARISPGSTDSGGRRVPPATEMGRSCQTRLGTCGPFYNQPALPVGSSCHCVTPGGPVSGVVVR